MGRTLVTLGLLILLFVAYQLWGTGIWTARAQSDLEREFAHAQQQYENDIVASPITRPRNPFTGHATTGAALVKPAPPIPNEGDAGGFITIPKINLKMVFVEGVSRDDLKKGPGHYPDTPFPGTLGNAAIAGHRTTYAHPFYDINELKPGDPIIIETAAGKFTYKMTKQMIVKPTEVSVVDNTPDAQLTLTSCNPRYSAAERIVIKAKLAPNVSPPPAKPRPVQGQGAGKASAPRVNPRRRLVGTDKEPRADDRVGLLRRARRSRVVVVVPPLAAPRDARPRRHPVRDRAVPVLRLPRTGAPRGLLRQP